MANTILNFGIASPFVLFNFATGSIESGIKPKYFMSLEHNRTCKQACTFKLTIVYVPDTFKEGQPTLIDNLLISSRNERVTYQYGYYDHRGYQHLQRMVYVGQLNKYNCDVDVANGTLTYTVEGNSVAVEILNIQTSITKDDFNRYNRLRWSPATIVAVNSTPDNESRHFYQLGLNYDRMILENDEFVRYSESFQYTQQGMMDIILGTAKASKETDNNVKQTSLSRNGGLVQHSRLKLADTLLEGYNEGLITSEEYKNYLASNWIDNFGWLSSNKVISTLQSKFNGYTSQLYSKLYTPFIAFFDDVAGMSHKYGTFYYIPKDRRMQGNSFVYEYGNNVRQSDVISISFSYDGSVALANASAASGISANIDETGQNIGQTQSVTNVLNLGRNTYATLSGFREDKFLSQRELQEYMIYPSKATLTIFGQTDYVSDILEEVDLIILINGTKHPTLSGEYTVLSINDSVSSNGFTTTLELIRKEKVSTILTENYVTNPTDGKAAETDEAINNAVSAT